jgi:hypothetical protein
MVIAATPRHRLLGRGAERVGDHYDDANRKKCCRRTPNAPVSNAHWAATPFPRWQPFFFSIMERPRNAHACMAFLIQRDGVVGPA